MSTLKADTIQSTSGGAATLTSQHAAKAWCSYNGSGTTFADSFNMTSATDNSAGNFTFTIANDMANADYAATSIVHPLTSTSPALHTCEVDCSSGYLAGSLRVEVAYGTTTNSRQEFDPVKCAVVFHGDLA